MRGVFFGVILAVMIFACARPPMPSQPPAVQEITMLWGQIRQWRHEAKMEVEPAASAVMAMRKGLPVGRTTCPDTRPPAPCADICDPADAICDNAERICGLAGELADTQWADWAKEKCASAKASCNEAANRCCECEKEQP